jgi:hypothetical protein
LFRRGADGNVIAFDLDLRDAVHFHRHAFARINFRRLDINGQQFERQQIYFLKNWQDKSAAALDDAKTN